MGSRFVVTGPGTVPATLGNRIKATPGNGPHQLGDGLIDIVHFTGAPEGCDADPAYPAGFLTGRVALICRGNCSFAEKVAKAEAAGAIAAFIFNNTTGGIIMIGLEDAGIPAYSISQAEGQALVSFLSTLSGAPAQADFLAPVWRGDVLSDFSLRGPVNPPAPGAQGKNNTFDVTKPDFAAPGDYIYAAYADEAVLDPANYGSMGGTSMATPHVAGTFALLRLARPDWSVAEIKSALMLTALNAGGVQDDLATPWTPDDVGSGRIDVARAAAAGLVLDETVANFLAANPATGGDVRSLNLPSMRHSQCEPSCTWTRTVKSTLAEAVTWNVSVEAPPGFQVTVEPASFNLAAAGATQTLTITASPQPGSASIAFGAVRLSTATPGQSPDLHLTIAVRGEGEGGADDVIFVGDFECADGLPDCGSGNPDIVVFENLDFVPNPDGTGVSVRWYDGFTCQCDGFGDGDPADLNFNVFDSIFGEPLFYWPQRANGVDGAVALDGGYAVLQSGATIGPDSQFAGTNGFPTTAWTVPGNVDGYLGFRFLHGGITKYGYARITTGPNGRPFTIVGIAYNNAGDPITIP